MVKVLIPRSVYEKHEKLSKYFIKFVAGYAVIDADEECMNYIKEKNIPHIMDRQAFEMHRLPISIPIARSLPREITLDQLFYLAGLDTFVENYNYPAFHLLDRAICLIDSGVDDAHEVFSRNQVTIEKRYISKFSDGSDTIGHGTAVASIIATMCPYSRIVSIKIFDSQSPTASITDFLESLDIALNSNCAVVNMSLGAMLSDRETTFLEPSMFRLAESESIVVASAGNEGMLDAVSYPARSKYAIGVGAIDIRYMRAWYSNIDPSIRKPEVVFFGDRINCATINNRYNVWSGTSFSAPAVSSILYWIYYFYYYARSNNLPVGYIVPSDPRRRWISDGRRVLIELAKRNNPALGEWNTEYGYGVPSYRRITRTGFPKIFLGSAKYRRPYPAKLSTAIPTPIFINIPDIGKLVPIPTISTETNIYNYYYNYVTQQYHEYITQYITNQYISESTKFVGGGGGGPYEVKTLIDFSATAPSTILEFPPLELRGYGYYGSSYFNLRAVRSVEIKIIPNSVTGSPSISIVGVQDIGTEEVVSKFDALEPGKVYSTLFLVSTFNRIRVVVGGSGSVSGRIKVSVVI
ncbi:MAG: S8/S53 family peptidase [Ignisphaera sp.]